MANDKVILVGESKLNATIWAPVDGPPRYAAEQLQHYIREMTGKKLPISKEESPSRIVIRVVPNVKIKYSVERCTRKK